MSKILSNSAKKAIYIGILCSMAYLSVSLARNVLSAVSPHLLEKGVFSEDGLGLLSSVYFMTYASGQLINGILGDRISPRYMIGFGLTAGAICVFLFNVFSHGWLLPIVFYGILGFCLSMIFGPMTRLIAENVDPSLTARTTALYTFAALFGSPLAGVLAVLFLWNNAFTITAVAVFITGIVCYITFLCFEKKGIIKKSEKKQVEKKKKNISVLFKRGIVKYTVISFVTGIIRTTVMFWLPTYLSQYLGFSANVSTLLFTVGTLTVSASPFVSVFIYERFGYRLNLTMLISFIVSAACFAGAFLIKIAVINVVLIMLAIVFSGCADSIMWSVYCPSLNDTGMVSGATGYLDFISYLAAAISSVIFANSVSYIGWKGLILVWLLLMLTGMFVSISGKRKEV